MAPETLSAISFALLGITAGCSVMGYLWSKKTSEYHRFIVNTKGELSEKSIQEHVDDINAQLSDIDGKIANSIVPIQQLKVALYDVSKTASHIDVGLPPPTFREYNSEGLKAEILKCRDKQYECITSGKASLGGTNWTFFGSRKDGEIMTRDYHALLLRAFNAEFEIIKKKMRFSTYEAAKAKLRKLDEQFAKLGETVGVYISNEYVDLKIEELNCWYFDLKRVEELKNDRARQRAILREQKGSAGDDIDEIEEELYVRQSELKRAKREAEKMAGTGQAQLRVDIETIQDQIAKLLVKQERATSQAQITRAGFIYVISNHGSFGEEMVKIGMTRRLEPMERVIELGDASVPFKFDVHTIAFVEDAPKVERTLHDMFNDTRVNTENNRKEFFYVKPNEVRAAMEKLGITADWYFDVEAKEYNESLLIRAAMTQQARNVKQSAALPDSI
jgi:hypothetical protein